MKIIPETRWNCPNCQAEDRTYLAEFHTRFHTCAGLAGLTTPFVKVGTKCKVIAVEREDYIGDEQVQRDANGRPVMAVLTIRDNGQDATVYAPTAVARVGVPNG